MKGGCDTLVAISLMSQAKDCQGRHMLNPNRRAMEPHAYDMSGNLSVVLGGSANSGLMVPLPS